MLGNDESKQQSSIREFFFKQPRVKNTAKNKCVRPCPRPAPSQSSDKKTPATDVAPTAASTENNPSNASPASTVEQRAMTVSPSSVVNEQPLAQESYQSTGGICSRNNSNKECSESKIRNNNTNTNKKQRKFQQLYLDFGQRNFGQQTVCPICGMLYVHGVEEDSKEHERICKEIREGVVFHFQHKACRVVTDFGGKCSIASGGRSGATKESTAANDGGYIVEVRPSDSYALRQKVSTVMAIVDKELGFAQESALSRESNTSRTGSPQNVCEKQSGGKKGRPAPTVFLYIRQKRVVGMVAAEVTRQAYRLLSVDNIQDRNSKQHHRQQYAQHERSTQAYRCMIGIHKLWVHSKARNQSIATRLVSSARARMVFGTVVPASLVAFSSPTEAGARFAQTYVRNETGSNETLVLVYDLPIT